MKILLIGGDRRMLYAKDALERRGHTVKTLGLLAGDGEDISGAGAVILPVPLTRDQVNINCALTGKKIPLEALPGLTDGARVFGGGKLALKNYTDYLSLDSYALKNAVLTAEGAICHMLGNTAFSLWKSNVLVIGYGRVGKILADRLSGFKPNLYVSARSEKDFAALEALSVKHICTSAIDKCDTRFDVVFNTVDIKHNDSVAAALSGSLYIDLSSRGELPHDAAENHGIKYERLPGIPAKTAPVTAGVIIAETVIEYLKSR